MINTRKLSVGEAGMVGLASKLGQIGSKWDKSGAFSHQFSVHLELAEPKCRLLKSDLEKSKICQTFCSWGQLCYPASWTYYVNEE